MAHVYSGSEFDGFTSNYSWFGLNQKIQVYVLNKHLLQNYYLPPYLYSIAATAIYTLTLVASYMTRKLDRPDVIFVVSRRGHDDHIGRKKGYIQIHYASQITKFCTIQYISNSHIMHRENL